MKPVLDAVLPGLNDQSYWPFLLFLFLFIGMILGAAAVANYFINNIFRK